MGVVAVAMEDSTLFGRGGKRDCEASNCLGMGRRRAILMSAFALAAVFVVAVQHDTFVRWWFLPRPPGPRPLLDRVVPEIRFANVYSDQHLNRLQAAAGVRIETPEGEKYWCDDKETFKNV